jgi:K(+)-stimulated pyrophosphate-energized sodium pump
MLTMFLAVFFTTLSFAFVEPFFFVGYLVSIAVFGLYQAIFMANAGGAWDNAKKIVEVDLHAKGTSLHDATIVGDTVGDPYKDTSSVALNPVIKFTTLFGLLAVELAASLRDEGHGALVTVLAVVLGLAGVFFVHRSFYGMRISRTLEDDGDGPSDEPEPPAPARDARDGRDGRDARDARDDRRAAPTAPAAPAGPTGSSSTPGSPRPTPEPVGADPLTTTAAH